MGQYKHMNRGQIYEFAMFKNASVTHNNKLVTMILTMIVLYGVSINMYTAIVPGDEWK